MLSKKTIAAPTTLTARMRRQQARFAGLAAAMITQRIAEQLDLPESYRVSLESAARHITSRNSRGAALNTNLPLIEQYRYPAAGDWAVGILRVAEAFALHTTMLDQPVAEMLVAMRADRSYYPTTVVTALALAIDAPVPDSSDVLRARAIEEGFEFLVARADREEELSAAQSIDQPMKATS
jgi:hypothetical protein